MKYENIKPMLLITSLIFANQAIAESSSPNPTNIKPGQNTQAKSKNSNFRFGGILQWDYERDKSEYIDDTSSSGVRRSRFYIKGHMNNWAYKATSIYGERSGTNGDNVELYIRYTGLGEQFNITVGKQKEPFSLEFITSSKDTSLLERSAITEYYAYGPSLGVQLHGTDKNWTYGLGIFESNNVNSDSFRNLTLTGRITKTLTFNNDALIHLGAGFTSREYPAVNKDITNYNLEFAIVHNTFHLQSEYFHSSKHPIYSTNQGHYIQVGYILNGIRLYKDGVFKSVEPQGKQGAWELVARYEKGLGKFSDINLGKKEGKQTSTGLNYYLNNNIRMGVSYMIGKSNVTSNENEELRARLQFYF